MRLGRENDGRPSSKPAVKTPLVPEDVGQEFAIPAIGDAVYRVVLQLHASVSLAAVRFYTLWKEVSFNNRSTTRRFQGGRVDGCALARTEHITDRALPSMIAPLNAGWNVVIQSLFPICTSHLG